MSPSSDVTSSAVLSGYSSSSRRIIGAAKARRVAWAARGGERSEPTGVLQCAIMKLISGQDLVDDAEVERLRRGQGALAEDEVLGPRRTQNAFPQDS